MSITDLINLIRFIIYKKRKKVKEILNSPKLKFEFMVIIQVFRGWRENATVWFSFTNSSPCHV